MIKQGCTWSTTIFRPIIIGEKKLEKEGKSFENVIFIIGSLLLADDGLIIAKNIEARENIRMLMNVWREWGPEINEDKSIVSVFNMKR